MPKDRDDEFNSEQYSLEEILAEFGSGAPESGVAQNLPYTPTQEEEDLREKREEAFLFPPKPKKPPEAPSRTGRSAGKREKPRRERGSSPTGDEPSPATGENITAFPKKPMPPVEELEAVPPQPPEPEETFEPEEDPTPPPARKDKVVEVEFPASQPENPVAAGFDQLKKKADHFADHMFEEEGAEKAKSVRRTERLIPGVDEEAAPPPPSHRERKPRKVQPPPPDTPPGELLKRYSKGFKSYRLRSWLVLALLFPQLYLTLTPAFLPALPGVPFLTDPTAVCYVMASFQGLAMALGIDALLQGLIRPFRRRISMDTMAVLANLLILADALVTPFYGIGTPHIPFCAAGTLSLWCVMYGELQKRRGSRLACRAACTASEPYLVTRDEGAWNNRDTYAKWSGPLKGFGSQLQSEDGAQRIYRVVTPLFLLAALLFSLIASVGQEKPENLLWCLSAIFAAACPLSCTMCFGLPWQRLSRRLSKTGAALAGWPGVTNTTGSSNLLLTDIDLFPAGSVTLNGIKIFGSFPLERIISYTASAIRDAGSGLEKTFHDLLRSQGAIYRRGELFTAYEGGGVSEVFGQDLVQVGSASFMVLMDVALPPGLKVKNAVFCAVNGELAGIFALNYQLPGTVPPALDILIHNRITPVLCTRDFNLIPSMLRHRFKLPVEKMEFPAVERRRELSDPKRPHSKTLTAVLCREGLGPYAEAIVGGRRLRSAVRTSAVLSCLGGIAGLLLAFYLTFISAYDSLTAANLLIFLLMWLVPTPLIGSNVDRY
ncbi:MAG: hypothetical protein J6J87_08795 [Oscillospiraceae bacterium]|nr:hypothetical protein [Oscillospiraceae bacterium]